MSIMKITDKTKDDVAYADLKPGDAFRLKGDLMPGESIPWIRDDDSGAVRLDGVRRGHHPAARVELLDTELIIHRVIGGAS